MLDFQESIILTEKVNRICTETGLPFWQVEEEVFADFWKRYPDWSPEARNARKNADARVNSDNEFEDQ